MRRQGSMTTTAVGGFLSEDPRSEDAVTTEQCFRYKGVCCSPLGCCVLLSNRICLYESLYKSQHMGTQYIL